MQLQRQQPQQHSDVQYTPQKLKLTIHLESALLLQCIDCIQQDGAADLPAGYEVAMVVNNLGSTPVMEMYIAARAALKYAQDKHKVQT